MYSFEGQYRRFPQQNLSGASVQQKKDELLHKVHEERMKREENRRRLQCAIRIQASIRSFLARQKFKEEQRQEYDVLLKQVQNLRTNTPDENESLSILTSKLIFFYHPSKDIKRLTFLSQKMLLKQDLIVTSSYNKINHWNYKLKKLLYFHLKLLVPGKDSFATPLRMIEVFTTDSVYMKYLKCDNVSEYLTDIYFYLLRNGYYQHFRDIVDKCMPPMVEPKYEPPTPFASSILDFIQRPLQLVQKNVNSSYNSLALESLLHNFLNREFSDAVRYFVIPCLSKFKNFPFSQLIHALLNVSSTQHDYHYSSWLLFTLISLEDENYLENCDEKQFSNYLELLSHLSQNFSKLGTAEMYSNRQNEDYDSDSEDEVEQESMISSTEIEILEEAAVYLNRYSKVQAIIAKASKYQNSSYENSIVESLAKISYHLLSAKKSALHEYQMLSSLALTSQFLRKLWQIITTKEQQTIFGNPASYINIISQGVELSPNECQHILPLFTTFCSLLMLLIATLHDHEFYSDEPNTGKTSIMPFTLQEISQVSFMVKEMCVGLVELAYPDCRPDLKLNARHDIKPKFSKDSAILNTWTRLFKVAVALLRQLHSRDLRRQFCAEGMWISTRISMLKFDKPLDLRSVARRHNLRPFRGLPCYTREDLEEGPPLSTRELRTMTVIKEMPFLLPFQERVVVFQNHVLKDKLEHQGEAPYAFRGRSIDVSVRRNYLYEDAFDKLSPANEPDLRYVMRVLLRNAVGLDEAGVDGGGLFREFLSELLKTAFDPNRGFFRLTNDNQLYPNPHVALLHPDFVKHYYFIGRMLGKAMYENLLVELPLADFFLSKLVNRHSDVGIHHLASLDVVMYKNLLFLKNYEGDVSDLGLDFTVVTDELGETKIIELKPNGGNIPVTNENKIEYIHLVADYKLNKQIGAQNTAFKNGLADVIQPQWLHMFSNKELQILISGAEIPVDISDLKRNTKYSGGYNENHPTIKIFWQVVEDFDDNQRRLLLKFVTSCSRQPLFGFKELDPPFCIQKAGSADRLPTSSTCMNLLKMPEFSDYNVLRDRILYAVQSGAGFELS